MFKTLTYLKNQSLETDLKTTYKRVNHKKPNFLYFKALETRI